MIYTQEIGTLFKAEPYFTFIIAYDLPFMVLNKGLYLITVNQLEKNICTILAFGSLYICFAFVIVSFFETINFMYVEKEHFCKIWLLYR